MEELLKYGFENKYIIIGIITALLGASARISYEKEVKVIRTRRTLSYFTTAIFVGYITYELLKYWSLERITGVACAIAGLTSIDIIQVLIESLPGMLKKRLGSEINPKENQNYNNTDENERTEL